MYNNSRREREDKILATVLSIGLLAVLILTNLAINCL